MEQQHRVYILLGTNLGDRKAQLNAARNALDTGQCKIVVASSIYETAPWGIHDQPDFLNQVLEIKTTCSPQQLLQLAQQLEDKAGPEKKQKWGPRHLDVDILFYDNKIIEEDHLKIPHPALHQRNFTLIPLVEIAPDFIHPVLHQSMRQLHKQCSDDTTVYKLQEA